MNRSLVAWLQEPCEYIPLEDMEDLLPANATRLQVYAAMIGIGGNSNGYGVISGGGLYRRVGMYQEEAFAYWTLKAYVSGWLQGTNGDEEGLLTVLLKEEWDRVKALSQVGVPSENEASDGKPAD